MEDFLGHYRLAVVYKKERCKEDESKAEQSYKKACTTGFDKNCASLW